MREHNVIQSILDQALLKTRENNSTCISALNFVRGEMIELDQNFIGEYWKEISKGTSAEEARLHFRVLSAEVQCMACFQKYRPEGGEIHCPFCGSYGAKILSGEEFYLESIETDHE